MIQKIWVLVFVTAVLPSLARASGFSTPEFSFEFQGVATLAVLGGIFCIYLGYKLFEKGKEKGKGSLRASSKFLTIVFSGVGPGLFFMAFGALILLTGVIASFASIVL